MVERRRLLEVLKWVPPEDNLYCTSLVSRLWYESSNTEEVWASLYSDLNLSLNSVTRQSSKEAFCLFYQHESQQLPIILSSSMKLFNCKSKTITSVIRLQKKLKQFAGTVTVSLLTGGLITCGGGEQASNQADHVSSSGEVTQLQNMRHGRCFHSAAVLWKTLYVFCGDRRTSRTAEKLRIEPLDTLTAREWEPLPNSLVRHGACHPCAYRTSIYLCGGNSDQSEMFDTAKSTFTLLPFTLPERQFGCVSFFRKGELVMLTTNNVSRWHPEGPLQSNYFDQLPCGYWTGRKQVLIDDTLFRESNGMHIEVIDLVRGNRQFLSRF